MTIEAVQKFVGLGVINDEFRNKLIGGKMTREQIADAVAGLDDKDTTAIILAILLSTGDFPGFSSEIDLYLNRRYGSGAAASGDDLPISV